MHTLGMEIEKDLVKTLSYMISNVVKSEQQSNIFWGKLS